MPLAVQVTCEDWTQLALNEGVASFMEYQAAAAALPALPALPLLFRWVPAAARGSVGAGQGGQGMACAGC